MTRTLTLLSLALLALAPGCGDTIVQVEVVQNNGCCDDGCDDGDEGRDPDDDPGQPIDHCDELRREVDECWGRVDDPTLCEELEWMWQEECGGGHPEGCDDVDLDGICDQDDDCIDVDWDGICDDTGECEDANGDGICDEDQPCDNPNDPTDCDDPCDDPDDAGNCGCEDADGDGLCDEDEDDECAALEEAFNDCMASGDPMGCEDILWLLEDLCWS